MEFVICSRPPFNFRPAPVFDLSAELFASNPLTQHVSSMTWSPIPEMRRWLAVVVMLLASAGLARAQSIIEGQIAGDDGSPIHDASLSLSDELSGQVRYGDSSDSTGRFRFVGVKPGRYVLAVSHIGFARASYPVAIRSDDRIRLAINLVKQSVVHREVIVSGRRATSQVTPITFSNLTAQDLESLPDMKDLPAALSTVPSVTYYTENGNSVGYSTLRMRGFDQRRIAVSINGIPQNDPEDFNVFWVNFFDVQGAVQDIQVQRGAGSSQFGSTGIGGAIDILARPYKPYRYAEAEVGVGAFGTRRFSVELNSGLLSNRYVAFARLSRLESDGYRDWSWTEFWRFFGGVTRYGERSTITLQAYGGPQKDGLAFSGIPRDANEVDSAEELIIDRRFNGSASTRDTESFHQPHAELHHEFQISDRVQLRQSLFWVSGRGYFDFGATFRSAEYLRLPSGFVAEELRGLPLFLSRPDVDVLFRAYLDQWQAGWLPRLTLLSGLGETTIGVEARVHRSLRWGRIQDASGIPLEFVGGAADRRVYEFRGEKLIGSLRASHALRSGDRFAVQADVLLTYHRYRVFDESFFGTEFSKPYVFLNPRIGLTMFPQRSVSFYASIAHATREPRLKSLYDGEEAGAGFTPQFTQASDGAYDFSDPLVKPERLVDFELGSTLRLSTILVTLNGYWMEFFDEIVPSGGLDQFGVPRTGNARRTRHIGLEAEADAGVSSSLRIQLNASLGRARYLDFQEFVTQPDLSVREEDRSGNPIPGFPTVIGHLRATYSTRGWQATVLARNATRQYIDNSGARELDGLRDDGLTVDPYTLVDLSASYSFGADSFLDGLTVGIDVNNVLNDRVLLFGNVGPLGPQFFPTATRHAFFRVKYVVR